MSLPPPSLESTSAMPDLEHRPGGTFTAEQGKVCPPLQQGILNLVQI